MATVSNSLVGSGVQPKFLETGVWAVECTQAIASNAASGTTYELFYISSGCKVLDLVASNATAIGTSTYKMRIGYGTTGNAYIDTYGIDSAWVARATGTGLFVGSAFTADTKITADLTGAVTAAGNLYVRALIAKADELS